MPPKNQIGDVIGYVLSKGSWN